MSYPFLNVISLKWPVRAGLEFTTSRMLNESTTTRLQSVAVLTWVKDFRARRKTIINQQYQCITLTSLFFCSITYSYSKHSGRPCTWCSQFFFFIAIKMSIAFFNCSMCPQNNLSEKCNVKTLLLFQCCVITVTTIQSLTIIIS